MPNEPRSNLYVRLADLEADVDLVSRRVTILERDKEIAAAVNDALKGYTDTAWTRRQRFVTIAAAILGAAGTVGTLILGFHGGRW